ncbi:MAG: tetratricopeptide repeat protein [Candidatus Hydrogenedentes bacterium]|nr:tetratricopeptide repeat protein [Candidatus Hydrogenedentota bacterium]
MKTEKQNDVKYIRLLAILLVIAFMLRFWYLTHVIEAPDFTSLRQDMSVQDYQARALLSGDWTVPAGRSDPEITATPYYRPPGYSYLLAAIYFVSGGSYLAPRIFNVLLGLLSILLMARLARILFGTGVALLTSALMVSYWGFIYYEGEVNDPVVFIFLLPCLLLTLHQWGRTRMVRWALLAGVITGSYALMRPNILLYGPIMAAWMLLLEWRAGRLKKTWCAWMALAGATALIIAPVTLRNYRVSGEFVPISTYFGENLLIGNSEDSDGHTSWTPYLQELEGTGQFSVWEYANIVQGLGREMENEHLTHSEASTIFAHKALKWIGDHKLATLQLALKKAVLFWSPWEITGNKVVHYEKAQYPPLKYMPGFPYLFALFLGGTLLLFKDQFDRFKGRSCLVILPAENAVTDSVKKKSVSTGDMLLLLYGLLLSYFFSFLPFFVNARARHPITGLMALIAAYGIYRIWCAWKNGDKRKVVAMALLFAACYGLARCELYSYTPDLARWHYARADSWLRTGEIDKAATEAKAVLTADYSYYMPFRLGHAFAAAGKPALAAELLEKALSPNPENQPIPYREDIYFHMGVALAADKQREAARQAFQEALRLNPDDARAHNDLGVLLEQTDDYEGALEHYHAAVEARPEFALAQSNLCDLLGRMGDSTGAITACEAAASAAPEVANYAYNLAVQFAAAGQEHQAIEQYRIALILAPEEVRILNNLALLLESQGEAAEAEALLLRVLTVDPVFTLARANLGNLYIRQGKIDSGLALYLDGLELIPDSLELLNGIGFQYATLEIPDKAREYYEAALEIEPGFTRARINLIQLCIETDALDDALSHLVFLIKKFPEEPQLHIDMGMLYVRQGDLDIAADCYKKALDLAPGRDDIRAGIESLKTPSDPVAE